MRVMVIRHHAEDSAGFITDAFLARGADVSTCLYPDGGPLPSFEGVDHIVMLGAIPSIYDPAIQLGRAGAPAAARGRRGGRAGARHLLRGAGAVHDLRRQGRRRRPQGGRLAHDRQDGPSDLIPGPVAAVSRGPLRAERGRDDPGQQRDRRPGVHGRAASGRAVPPRGRRRSAADVAGVRRSGGGPERGHGPRRPARPGAYAEEPASRARADRLVAARGAAGERPSAPPAVLASPGSLSSTERMIFLSSAASCSFSFSVRRR